jgi:HTH-type transcriptional regulator, sugar sensing transcriptional regulator
MNDATASMVERLTQLGFSQYEAKTYVGLLVNGEQTGYALSNLTGVPQPKVYETLRRLVERGAVVQLLEKPATYSAIPAKQLFTSLEADFKRRLTDAQEGLKHLQLGPAEDQRELIWKLNSLENTINRATSSITSATSTVYLSGTTASLERLKGVVTGASERGVKIVMLHFGPLPFALPRGRTFRHASTEGSLYPHHQAHHLAIVTDSARALWAIARDGQLWDGLYSEDRIFASVVKGYIRHDVMIQRIYADFPAEMTNLYGPGLLELARISSSGNEVGWIDEENEDQFLTG